jgi:hypothetical protein
VRRDQLGGARSFKVHVKEPVWVGAALYMRTSAEENKLEMKDHVSQSLSLPSKDRPLTTVMKKRLNGDRRQ